MQFIHRSVGEPAEGSLTRYPRINQPGTKRFQFTPSNTMSHSSLRFRAVGVSGDILCPTSAHNTFFSSSQSQDCGGGRGDEHIDMVAGTTPFP